MKIIEKNIKDITPYENNPRNNEDAVEKVAESIKEFGFQQPIVVDKDNVIIVGHTRLKAAERLGLDKVPVVIADELTEEQAKAYRLADNKTNEIATWKFDVLNKELLDIGQIDMSKFGFDMSALADDLVAEEDDYVLDGNIEAKVKQGDIWQLGEHRLMCGDSTSVNDVETLMGGVQADMVFTDPPYGVAYTGGMKIENGKIESNGKKQIKNDALDYEELYQFLSDVFANIKVHTKGKSAVYVFYAHSRSREFLNAFHDASLKQRSIIIWHKTSGGFGDFMAQYMNAYEPCIYGSNGEAVNWYGATNETTVWDMDKEKKCDLHPTMKPIELVGRAIKNSSKKDDVVLDCFGGSGSTLIACEQLNRKCYMMELDPHYCSVIIDRWESFTGQKAIMING